MYSQYIPRSWEEVGEVVAGPGRMTRPWARGLGPTASERSGRRHYRDHMAMEQTPATEADHRAWAARFGPTHRPDAVAQLLQLRVGDVASRAGLPGLTQRSGQVVYPHPWSAPAYPGLPRPTPAYPGVVRPTPGPPDLPRASGPRSEGRGLPTSSSRGRPRSRWVCQGPGVAPARYSGSSSRRLAQSERQSREPHQVAPARGRRRHPIRPRRWPLPNGRPG